MATAKKGSKKATKVTARGTTRVEKKTSGRAPARSSTPAKSKAPAKKSGRTSKTQVVLGAAGPKAYLAALPEPRKTELATLDALIRETLPELAIGMYGSSMLGYGPFHYSSASGCNGEACRVALSSRAQYISLYCLGTDDQGHVAERYKSRLPKADIGKSCVRFKTLADVDLAVIRDLLRATVKAGYSGM